MNNQKNYTLTCLFSCLPCKMAYIQLILYKLLFFIQYIFIFPVYFLFIYKLLITKIIYYKLFITYSINENSNGLVLHVAK